MPTPPVTRTVTVWFNGGRNWSFTCSNTEAQYFVAYATGAEIVTEDGGYPSQHGGIFSPPSAPGRYIVWANVTDFQII